jgi:hypothetical protein
MDIAEVADALGVENYAGCLDVVIVSYFPFFIFYFLFAILGCVVCFLQCPMATDKSQIENRKS